MCLLPQEGSPLNLLQLPEELLDAHVLPCLPFDSLQTFGHSCRAARRAVSRVPDSHLGKLAQARGRCSQALKNESATSS